MQRHCYRTRCTRKCKFIILTVHGHDKILQAWWYILKALRAYQLTVPNGVVCGGAVAPDYFCPRPSITTSEERVLPTGEKHVVIRADCSAFVNAGGNYYCQDTFVMDRDDALIAMPIPIVSIRCEMRTQGVIGVINPQIRRPNTFDSELVWVPKIQFFKTEFGHDEPIPVPALNPQVS